MVIEWQDLSYRTYVPDFVLPNGIIIESKGYLTAENRRKHLKIKQQHPELDIRFVFENPQKKIYKKSDTTYAKWCIKHGFRYSDGKNWIDWLEEPKKKHMPDDVIRHPESNVKRRRRKTK